MGRTYRAARRVLGAKKARNHRVRSAWTAQNGTRLRSLSVDIQDFQLHEDSSGVSLHMAPSKKAQAMAERITQLVKQPQIPETPKPPKAPPKKEEPKLKVVHEMKKPTLRDKFSGLETHLLTSKREYAKLQAEHLANLASILRREFRFGDKVLLDAITRLEAKRRNFITEIGTITAVLLDRSFGEEIVVQRKMT